MIVRLYSENPNEKTLSQIVEILSTGGVIVYPTDSVYAFGCSLKHPKAIDRLRKISGKQGSNFSLICTDLSDIATYAKVDTPTFKLLKRNLPGPFTFILEASGKVPDKFLEKKRTVGIRIPDNVIPRTLVEALGFPLVSASVKCRLNEESEYTTDPSLIHDCYADQVDLVVDGGYGNSAPTTVVDCTGGEPIVIRQGIGELM